MDLLERLLRHDSSITLELLRFAADIDDAALDREFDLGLRTVRRTLRHLVECNEDWLDQMQGQSARWDELDRQMPIDMLTTRYRTVADEFYAFARRVSEEGRLDDTFIDPNHNPPSRKTFGGCITHLATHAMHHRAQLLFMLRRLGVADVPEGDALSWERQYRGGWAPA
ncbi:MAG: DinB family protein [Planctomycetota bacterium]